MSMKKLRAPGNCVLLLLVLGFLSACGGSSSDPVPDAPPDSDSMPNAPSLTLTPEAIKTFRFSWDSATGVSEYRLLENPDQASGYSRVATISGDAISYDLGVFLPGRMHASYILQACNSAGCSDSSPVFVSGSLAAAVGYIKASNTGAGDQFGLKFALSDDGTTLAVGAPHATGGGAAYIYTLSNGVWLQQAYLKASNTEAGDRFGWNVALSADGNTLAVGATLEDSGATGVDGDQGDGATHSGAVYLFGRSGTTWLQQAYIKASNTDAFDEFGYSVALSADGNTLAVGAPLEGSNATVINGDQSNNDLFESGAVYVFVRSGTAWAQQAYIKASTSGIQSLFGFSLALAADGNTLMVGHPFGVSGGAVYAFNRSGFSWLQQQIVKASNLEVADRFGYSIALSGDGDTLAVGATQEDGSAIGIGGDENSNDAIGSGAVYLFARGAGSWSQQTYVKASNTEASDRFGQSVALSASGDTLAVGAMYEDSSASGISGDQQDGSASDSGAVYLFSANSGAWSQKAYLKASNTEAGDWFGGAVALSADGNTLAVGATREDSNATDIDGDQGDNSAIDSGAVYLY